MIFLCTFQNKLRISKRKGGGRHARIRSSGQNSKNSKEYPVMVYEVYEPLWRGRLGMRILMDF